MYFLYLNDSEDSAEAEKLVESLFLPNLKKIRVMGESESEVPYLLTPHRLYVSLGEIKNYCSRVGNCPNCGTERYS